PPSWSLVVSYLHFAPGAVQRARSIHHQLHVPDPRVVARPGAPRVGSWAGGSGSWGSDTAGRWAPVARPQPPSGSDWHDRHPADPLWLGQAGPYQPWPDASPARPGAGRGGGAAAEPPARH